MTQAVFEGIVGDFMESVRKAEWRTDEVKGPYINIDTHVPMSLRAYFEETWGRDWDLDIKSDNVRLYPKPHIAAHINWNST